MTGEKMKDYVDACVILKNTLKIEHSVKIPYYLIYAYADIEDSLPQGRRHAVVLALAQVQFQRFTVRILALIRSLYVGKYYLIIALYSWPVVPVNSHFNAL